MNSLKKPLAVSFRHGTGISKCFFSKPANDGTLSILRQESDLNGRTDSVDSNPLRFYKRNLPFCPKYVKPRQVWVENFDEIKEKKRGLIDLHPSIFGTMPRLDLIFENVKWQNLYSTVVLFSAKNRIEMKGGGRKPYPQKGLGFARQGSIRAPHYIKGGTCHGPRNPTTYYYMPHYSVRLHGITSTLSAKFAQDDLHVIDNLNIPTDDRQFILDLIKERNWGPSVLIVDVNDIMPEKISIATASINQVNLMPVYGLNVHGMLKHDTLVLTLAAVEEIENKLVTLLNSATSKLDDLKYRSL